MDAPVIVVLIAGVFPVLIDGLNAVLNRAVYAVLIGALTGVLITMFERSSDVRDGLDLRRGWPPPCRPRLRLPTRRV